LKRAAPHGAPSQFRIERANIKRTESQNYMSEIYIVQPGDYMELIAYQAYTLQG
jgi:hypothetical protein